MATVITQIASTTEAAQAQLDLLRNSIHRLAGSDRIINGAAIAGGSAAGAILVEIYVGDVNVATLANQSTTLQVPRGYELYPLEAVVPGGAELRAIIAKPDAGTAVGLVLVIELDDLDDEAEDLDAMIEQAAF